MRGENEIKTGGNGWRVGCLQTEITEEVYLLVIKNFKVGQYNNFLRLGEKLDHQRRRDEGAVSQGIERNIHGTI